MRIVLGESPDIQAENALDPQGGVEAPCSSYSKRGSFIRYPLDRRKALARPKVMKDTQVCHMSFCFTRVEFGLSASGSLSQETP